MKKIIAILALISILLVGCNKKDDSADLEKTNKAKAKAESIGVTDPSSATEKEEPTIETIDLTAYNIPEGEGVDFLDEVEESDENKSDTQKAENKVTEPTVNDNQTEGNKEKDNNTESENPTEFPKSEGCNCEYQQYLAMSPENQEAFMDSFSSVKDFINWCREKEAEHESHITTIIVSSGELDVSEIIP